MRNMRGLRWYQGRARWCTLGLAVGLASAAYLVYSFSHVPTSSPAVSPSEFNANHDVLGQAQPIRLPESRTTEATRTETSVSAEPRTEQIDYVAFAQRFEQLMDGQTSPPQSLYNRLHDPGAFLERLRALQTYEPEAGWFGVQGQQVTRPTVGLHVGTHLDTATGELQEQEHFSVLPAALGLEVVVPSYRYLDRGFVRWVDTQHGQVVGMEMVEFDGLAGSQRFSTRPEPEVEAGFYRIEVYSAEERLERLADVAISVGDDSHVVTGKSVSITGH